VGTLTTLPAFQARAAACAARRARVAANAGFTLIELVVVLMVAAILLAVGLPGFQNFVRDQRVRAISSDMVGDFALARTEALRFSTRVIIARAGSSGCTLTGTTWREGWCIFADTNGNTTMDAGEQLKIQQAVDARVRICSAVAEFANRIIFGSRGQVIRTTAVGANDGITITDDSTGVANSRTRTLMFGMVGRVTTVNQDLATPPC